MEADEQEKIRLNAVTIDRVTCGEQQPESDHFIASERSDAGAIEATHWRDAQAWFSYRMRNNNKNARFLYVQYLDRDPDRRFDVLVNGTKLQTIFLAGDKKDELQTVILPFTIEQTNQESLTIRFNALEGSRTGKIVAVRLITENL